MEFCYRKLDHLKHPEPARFYRDLTNLYTRAGHHDRAGRTSRRVVDIYVGGGHRSAAVGYLRSLPQSGSQRGYASSELRRLLKSPAAPPPQVAAQPAFEGTLGCDAILGVAAARPNRSRPARPNPGTSGLIHSARAVRRRAIDATRGIEALEAIVALESAVRFVAMFVPTSTSSEARHWPAARRPRTRGDGGSGEHELISLSY